MSGQKRPFAGDWLLGIGRRVAANQTRALTANDCVRRMYLGM
jgi:hypothetical protein